MRALARLTGRPRQAARMLRRSPWLQRLPRFCLAPDEFQRSNYRIRKQPAEQCLSTLECIARVLEVVEPERPETPQALLRAFDAMVRMPLPPGARNSR